MRNRIPVLLSILLLCLSTFVYAQEQSTTEQFTKLSDQGTVLPADAPRWAMVRDNISELIWEVKTTDDSIHDLEKVFSWKSAREEFIAELNNIAFGGFTDWRLPTTSELQTIKLKGAEPYINQDFFPHTVPTSYLSWRKCGNGDIYDERVKFGKVRNTKKDRRVRAVRSGAVSTAEK